MNLRITKDNARDYSSSHRTRREEWIFYFTAWIVVAALYLIDHMRGHLRVGNPMADLEMLYRMVVTLAPFFLLFLFNNFILVRRLLLRNRLWQYFLSATATVFVVWIWQYFNFNRHELLAPEGFIPPPPRHHVRPLLPLPLVLDFTYGLLVVGVNMAVALLFRRLDESIERESLLKANAESELAILKAQINPHFYMNMLNNIHGMIEIDPERAQEMVIGMSRLMRHILYESSRPMVTLASEVAFLNSYIDLMRQRYAPGKVSITSTMPSPAATEGVKVPSLLMLVFIENAFKHGVSYNADSYVAVSIEVENGSVLFSCINSRHAASVHGDAPSHECGEGGVGLRNARQRLSLIYGADYGTRARLDIHETPSTYTVNLILPAHEVKNIDN